MVADADAGAVVAPETVAAVFVGAVVLILIQAMLLYRGVGVDVFVIDTNGNAGITNHYKL